ncbi:UDP-N-acetylglucosamine 4,6-dehydratase (inverting) [Desulfovibrio mangrovi]|uniref:UDP-N-acetylglucosamine 4,6-dehydratase (inverting) n=1 Tax=Desulfovibrio mangrovi TaxID=2976983 RepID=UPI0022480C2D|nr:UDP-N-acetylglucosamine 4,6-dehydratase (inverting) [Desulfovibrio mangrovi]UZP66806.1 UDP-N-acetylglucosamine 4,6-dehydratase (inverting) [Desulfovibrio mangrovi]
MFDGKTILITGGTGSFGKKCVELVLQSYKPNRLIVFSRDELKQFEMAQRFSPETYRCMRYFIGDVRDKERLYRAFRGVDYVIHAAALKQVPAAEYNPTECIRTNIYGAENIVNAAADLGVQKVVALSTDKAVAPVNLYGATKLCSDKLFVAANAFTGCDTVYSVVRYGNVMGSRGSVIPFFIQRRDEGGPLSITDNRMTRFWITLEESVRMVLNAFEQAGGGEVFVPKIPSMRITDLAEAIAPGMETVQVGIRPGEKLHETMITAEDSRHTIDIGDYYVIKPETFRYRGPEGTPVADGFEYNSSTNETWLSAPELRTILRKQGFDVQ